MTDLHQPKPGGKSARSKKKRDKKKAEQQVPAPEQAESEALYAAMAEPAAPAAEVTRPDETTPAESVVEPTAPVAQPETAPTEPVERVERVASFKERMASVVPPMDTAPVKPAMPSAAAEPAPSPAAAPATAIQAIANAYRDYTRKSLEDAQSFAEKLSAARSLDKAVEAQTEFARQACETFADNSRKIRELHRELFWQAFRLPSWLPGRTRQGSS